MKDKRSQLMPSLVWAFCAASTKDIEHIETYFLLFLLWYTIHDMVCLCLVFGRKYCRKQSVVEKGNGDDGGKACFWVIVVIVIIN